MKRRVISKIRITAKLGDHRRTVMFVSALKYVPAMKEVLRKQGYEKLWTKVERK